ncbi:pX [Psittacine adenovirus 2]|uniref:PX n=1 Tax=Psittacine adenovirus 2 TaxID=1301246 RepID=A0ABX8SQ83_9ADEN|nr:pX [Psittacine adenovirus 2]QZW33249.1 ORF10 pX [Psittacine siadenovirus F]QZW33693.1 ORF10 pX [Psittacine adenovirus 2]WGL41018.1 pX [Psittacine siadenovirus F]WGL41043.1 pX [Psittacine siadenovirus F]
MFENLAPRKGLGMRIGTVKFSRELRGGFLQFLIPLLASAITAAPGIAGAIIAAKHADK